MFFYPLAAIVCGVCMVEAFGITFAERRGRDGVDLMFEFDLKWGGDACCFR